MNETVDCIGSISSGLGTIEGKSLVGNVGNDINSRLHILVECDIKKQESELVVNPKVDYGKYVRINRWNLRN